MVILCMMASSKPIPLRLSVDILAQVKQASERLGMSEQETIRLALRTGLEDLAQAGFDLPGAVLKSLNRPRAAGSPEAENGEVEQPATA